VPVTPANLVVISKLIDNMRQAGLIKSDRVAQVSISVLFWLGYTLIH
jgi:hypothetical protein